MFLFFFRQRIWTMNNLSIFIFLNLLIPSLQAERNLCNDGELGVVGVRRICEHNHNNMKFRLPLHRVKNNPAGRFNVILLLGLSLNPPSKIISSKMNISQIITNKSYYLLVRNAFFWNGIIYFNIFCFIWPTYLVLS